ncbi:hypothetical protein [Pyxidicoccus sp. MSG2]|uniref:hypothetical protein n=1 Tax=Pyxidicoccus sp. MSG2 TaxID=2996790 RepID=UPI00226EA7A6|nr:hypothetical protein [Pyxidicoccus sp. MSG2]MCY1018160.1 hypothetical protein [Pyxidicoccus sp. MSG2]
MRATLIGGLLTAGLLMGCGGVEGPEADVEEPLPVTAQAVPPPQFCTYAYTNVYYSDATYTAEVGREVCRCGFRVFIIGPRTPYAAVSQRTPCGGEG